MKPANLAAASLRSSLFRQKIVKAKKGRGAYRRKAKHKIDKRAKPLDLSGDSFAVSVKRLLHMTLVFTDSLAFRTLVPLIDGGRAQPVG